MRNRSVETAAVAFGVLVLVGCATPQRNWAPEEHSAPSFSMQLAPGDEVDIRFFGAPELNARQIVRRDGMITLQLVGDLQVAGKTPAEVQEDLSQVYADQLQVKEVAVLISSPAPVFVSGAVLTPGPVRTVRPTTALEAIMETGGFDFFQAKTSEVLVLRHVEGRWKAFRLNYKGVLKGDSADPFFLEPFDIVHVSRTKIVEVNQWVEQYINRMIPRLPFAVDSDGNITYFFN